jgi:hypothetical protein
VTIWESRLLYVFVFLLAKKIHVSTLKLRKNLSLGIHCAERGSWTGFGSSPAAERHAKMGVLSWRSGGCQFAGLEQETQQCLSVAPCAQVNVHESSVLRSIHRTLVCNGIVSSCQSMCKREEQKRAYLTPISCKSAVVAFHVTLLQSACIPINLSDRAGSFATEGHSPVSGVLSRSLSLRKMHHHYFVEA